MTDVVDPFIHAVVRRSVRYFAAIVLEMVTYVTRLAERDFFQFPFMHIQMGKYGLAARRRDSALTPAVTQKQPKR